MSEPFKYEPGEILEQRLKNQEKRIADLEKALQDVIGHLQALDVWQENHEQMPHLRLPPRRFF